METKLSIIILNHLNDVKVEVGTLDRACVKKALNRIDFVNFLILKFKDTTIEVDPEKEYDLFLEFQAKRKGE